MIEVEVENRSGVEVDEEGAVDLARRVLTAEGVDAGELGLVFVGPEESRALKLEHLGIDDATDARCASTTARPFAGSSASRIETGRGAATTMS